MHNAANAISNLHPTIKDGNEVCAGALASQIFPNLKSEICYIGPSSGLFASIRVLLFLKIIRNMSNRLRI